MLNRDVVVPDKTIALIFNEDLIAIDKERINSLIERPSKKRDWFSPFFYHCLPLTIGNQYGFVLKTEMAFEVEWDGGDSPDSVHIAFFPDQECSVNYCQCEAKRSTSLELVDGKYCWSRGQYPKVYTSFGHGILTLTYPFVFRTPPGVNLMTINPPNEVLPNITVMTGVVETDNLRRDFTFNLKIQQPHIKMRFPKGCVIAGIIPVPRYFCDEFSLKFADELFDEETIVEELNAMEDTYQSRREVEPHNKPHGLGRHYFKGEDVYGNQFPDHQRTT